MGCGSGPVLWSTPGRTFKRWLSQLVIGVLNQTAFLCAATALSLFALQKVRKRSTDALGWGMVKCFDYEAQFITHHEEGVIVRC